LREEGFAVEEAAVGKRAIELLALSRFDVVLTDLMMRDVGRGAARESARRVSRQPGGGADGAWMTDSVVQAMKAGAFDYLEKPTDREKLVTRVAKAAEFANLQQENQLLKRRLEGTFGKSRASSGQDPAIQEVIAAGAARPPVESTVLIQGESGTPGGNRAKAIHRLSHARRGSSSRSTARDSREPDRNELFGHDAVRSPVHRAQDRAVRERGQIDAVSRRDCRLPQGMQAKILRVLQEKELRRVGGNDRFGSTCGWWPAIIAIS